MLISEFDRQEYFAIEARMLVQKELEKSFEDAYYQLEVMLTDRRIQNEWMKRDLQDDPFSKIYRFMKRKGKNLGN